MRPNGRGIASGGGDKEVKCWDFELVTAKVNSRLLLLPLFARVLMVCTMLCWLRATG